MKDQKRMGQERAMMEGLEERRMMSVTSLGMTDITDGTSNTISFAETSGRITAIAVDPSDPSGNTIYISGANGGVWKTTNF